MLVWILVVKTCLRHDLTAHATSGWTTWPYSKTLKLPQTIIFSQYHSLHLKSHGKKFNTVF